MRRHLQLTALVRGSRPGTKSEVNLATDQGEQIEDYSIVFRELFCVAAANLAEQINEPLDNVGVLFDEIIATGQKARFISRHSRKKATPESSIDIERDGINPAIFGRGQLLFLTRRANRRQAEHFQESGYRFANVNNVVDILARAMEIETEDLKRKLTIMREYSNESHILEPGVHFACFAIRASVRGGFDILVRRDARNQLPTMQMPIAKLGPWHNGYIMNLDGLTVAQCLKWLRSKSPSRVTNKRETVFASQLFDTLDALKDEINDPFFLEAVCVAKTVDAPCKGYGADARPSMAQVIAFRLIAPIHSRAPGQKLEFIPFNFVRMHQHVYKNSPDHGVWARKIHREFGPILHSGTASETIGSSKLRRIGSAQSTLFPWSKRLQVKSDEIPLARLSHKALGREGLDSSSEKATMEQQSFGGIMVSQEVSVDVHDLRTGTKHVDIRSIGDGDSDMEVLSRADSDHDLGRLVGSPAALRRDSKGNVTGGVGIKGVETLCDNHGIDICLGTSSGVTKEIDDPETFVDRLFAVCIENR